MASRVSASVVVTTAVLVGALLSACVPDARTGAGGPPGDRPPASAPSSDRLEPTLDDGLSPSYKPGSPVRSVVGTGHVLTGRVVSSRDGSPIAGAKLELWPEYATRGHVDEARAAVFTDGSGRYRFQCDPPEHIHMRITADGYVGIAQNSYHPDGRPEGTFDIVLRPE